MFTQKLRNKTREPYFDNKNKRRLDTDDLEGTIYADEYDNLISLRNEVLNKHWIVFKTLILFGNKKKTHFWTISYPGHFAILFPIISIFGFFAGVYVLLTQNDYRLLMMSIGMYIVTVYLSKDDYKSHHSLIKKCNSSEE